MKAAHPIHTVASLARSNRRLDLRRRAVMSPLKTCGEARA